MSTTPPLLQGSFLICLAIPYSNFLLAIFESVRTPARSYRTLRDGSFGVALSQALRAWLRSAVPLGRNTFRPSKALH